MAKAILKACQGLARPSVHKSPQYGRKQEARAYPCALDLALSLRVTPLEGH